MNGSFTSNDSNKSAAVASAESKRQAKQALASLFEEKAATVEKIRSISRELEALDGQLGSARDSERPIRELEDRIERGDFSSLTEEKRAITQLERLKRNLAPLQSLSQKAAVLEEEKARLVADRDRQNAAIDAQKAILDVLVADKTASDLSRAADQAKNQALRDERARLKARLDSLFTQKKEIFEARQAAAQQQRIRRERQRLLRESQEKRDGILEKIEQQREKLVALAVSGDAEIDLCAGLAARLAALECGTGCQDAQEARRTGRAASAFRLDLSLVSGLAEVGVAIPTGPAQVPAATAAVLKHQAQLQEQSAERAACREEQRSVIAAEIKKLEDAIAAIDEENRQLLKQVAATAPQ